MHDWCLRCRRAARTPDDARTMILETLSDGMQRRPEWQNAAGKLMAAAETGTPGDIEAATVQVERALFMAGRLVLR